MKFFRRIADLWLHAILLTEGPQEPLHDLSIQEQVIPDGKELQVHTSLIDPSLDCKHGPQNRTCWTPGFNINTDYERSWPDTRRVVQVFHKGTLKSLSLQAVENACDHKSVDCSRRIQCLPHAY